MRLGLGKPDPDGLVFCRYDGSPISPSVLSVTWCRMVQQVSFHSLRHCHASALIAAGMDVVRVSRRLGHSSPTITLGIYAHLFGDGDDGAAVAVERMMKR